MASSDELESLLKQKQELDARDDLSAEEKKKLARTLRRKIRNLGGTVRVLHDSTASASPRSPRAPRVTGRSSRHQPKQFEEYKENLLAELADKGLEWKVIGELLDITAYGLSLHLMYNENVTSDEIMEKFRHRWASANPKWFAVGSGNTDVDYILLGPLPPGMTISN